MHEDPSARRLRAVLFDFDGTLGDSYPAITASVNHVREHYGLSKLTTDKVKRNVGRGAEYLLTQTVPGGEAAAYLPRVADQPDRPQAHERVGMIERLEGRFVVQACCSP